MKDQNPTTPEVEMLVGSDDIASARAFHENFRGNCDTMNEANLACALGNTLAALDILHEALAALYGYQQTLSSPDTRWGLPIYQNARAALALVNAPSE